MVTDDKAIIEQVRETIDRIGTGIVDAASYTVTVFLLFRKKSSRAGENCSL